MIITRILVTAIVSLLLVSTSLFAQTMEDRLKTLEDTLKKQEETIQGLKVLEETLKRQEHTITEQRKLIEELKAAVKQHPAPAPAAAAKPSETAGPGGIQQEVKELKEKVEQVAEAQKKEVVSVFNPSIGLVGETIFSHNNRTSAQTGAPGPAAMM